MNILIVKLSAIGDVIHTLPALNALRQHCPDARITWLVEEAAAELVIGHPALDRVIVSKRKQWIRRLKSKADSGALFEIYNFIRELRDTYYDMILDFQALLKSGILIALTRGKRKIGFGPGMEHMEHSTVFLNERIPAVSMEVHALTRNLMLLDAIGIPHEKIEYHIPIFRDNYTAARELLARHGLTPDRPLVAINPVAKWDTKLWDFKRFAELADLLNQRLGARVFFTGSHDDHGTIESIILNMHTPAVNLSGQTTLKVLGALYQLSKVLVSTDTGPMHLSAAVETPVVSLFGPTAPWRTGPFGPQHQVVRAHMNCSPCFKRHCQSMDCMDRIDVKAVYNAVETIVAASHPASKPIQQTGGQCV